MSRRPLVFPPTERTWGCHRSHARYAKKKLKNKRLDLIVANDVSNKEIGFDSNENEVTLITNSEEKLLEKQNKKKISKKIIDFISSELT